MRPPRNPKHALKFCHIFPDMSCCLPAQDAEIEEHYFNLLDAGDICAKESSMAKDALKKIFCAACSPQQPKYITADMPPKFRICSSLAKRVTPTCFDDCGMVRVAERGDLCGGDDVIVPSKYWHKCKADTKAKWFDSDSGSLTSGGDDCEAWTPADAANDVPKCCADETEAECATSAKYQTSDGSEAVGAPYSCTGFWKFINDDTGAKPPFLEDYEVEIFQCDGTHTDGTPCSNHCYTGAATRAAISWVVSLGAVLMMAMIVA